MPDIKICWFAVTQLGLQEAYRSKNCFDAHSWKIFFFFHKCIMLAMITLESKVNFLFFLLYHFLVVPVVLVAPIVPNVLWAGFTRLH